MASSTIPGNVPGLTILGYCFVYLGRSPLQLLFQYDDDKPSPFQKNGTLVSSKPTKLFPNLLSGGFIKLPTSKSPDQHSKPCQSSSQAIIKSNEAKVTFALFADIRKRDFNHLSLDTYSLYLFATI